MRARVCRATPPTRASARAETHAIRPRLTAFAAFLALAGCASHPPATPASSGSRLGNDSATSGSGELGVQRGEASFYGERFRGKRTASGARFNPDALTCAHRTLPFGTLVEVRRRDTGQSVTVTVTDRGPFGARDRIVDLSLAAARALTMTKLGVVTVELRVIGH